MKRTNSKNEDEIPNKKLALTAKDSLFPAEVDSPNVFSFSSPEESEIPQYNLQQCESALAKVDRFIKYITEIQGANDTNKKLQKLDDLYNEDIRKLYETMQNQKITVAMVGEAGVGKSTLMNYLLMGKAELESLQIDEKYYGFVPLPTGGDGEHITMRFISVEKDDRYQLDIFNAKRQPCGMEYWNQFRQEQNPKDDKELFSTIRMFLQEAKTIIPKAEWDNVIEISLKGPFRIPKNIKLIDTQGWDPVADGGTQENRKIKEDLSNLFQCVDSVIFCTLRMPGPDQLKQLIYDKLLLISMDRPVPVLVSAWQSTKLPTRENAEKLVTQLRGLRDDFDYFTMEQMDPYTRIQLLSELERKFMVFTSPGSSPASNQLMQAIYSRALLHQASRFSRALSAVAHAGRQLLSSMRRSKKTPSTKELWTQKWKSIDDKNEWNTHLEAYLHSVEEWGLQCFDEMIFGAPTHSGVDRLNRLTRFLHRTLQEEAQKSIGVVCQQFEASVNENSSDLHGFLFDLRNVAEMRFKPLKFPKGDFERILDDISEEMNLQHLRDAFEESSEAEIPPIDMFSDQRMTFAGKLVEETRNRIGEPVVKKIRAQFKEMIDGFSSHVQEIESIQSILREENIDQLRSIVNDLTEEVKQYKRSVLNTDKKQFSRIDSNVQPMSKMKVTDVLNSALLNQTQSSSSRRKKQVVSPVIYTTEGVIKAEYEQLSWIEADLAEVVSERKHFRTVFRMSLSTHQSIMKHHDHLEKNRSSQPPFQLFPIVVILQSIPQVDTFKEWQKTLDPLSKDSGEALCESLIFMAVSNSDSEQALSLLSKQEYPSQQKFIIVRLHADNLHPEYIMDTMKSLIEACKFSFYWTVSPEVFRDSSDLVLSVPRQRSSSLARTMLNNQVFVRNYEIECAKRFSAFLKGDCETELTAFIFSKPDNLSDALKCHGLMRDIRDNAVPFSKMQELVELIEKLPISLEEERNKFAGPLKHDLSMIFAISLGNEKNLLSTHNIHFPKLWKLSTAGKITVDLTLNNVFAQKGLCYRKKPDVKQENKLIKNDPNTFSKEMRNIQSNFYKVSLQRGLSVVSPCYEGFSNRQ